VNGDFEQNAGWEFPQTPLPASYTRENCRSGSQGARSGAFRASANVYSYSSLRQGITIPANATQVNLYYSLWQQTTESPLAALAQQPRYGTNVDAMGQERATAGDVQYVLVLNSNNQVIKTLYWNRKNTKTWNSFTVDLTQFKGQTIKLQFGTFNDGAGGYTGMDVDNVVIYATTP
jgi:Immune inhibitor A-like, MAM domain